MNWSGKCEGPGGGDRRGALCTGFTLVRLDFTISKFHKITPKINENVKLNHIELDFTAKNSDPYKIKFHEKKPPQKLKPYKIGFQKPKVPHL